MSPAERQRRIVEHLDVVGACVYPDLAQRLGVSEMTVRRDVDRLVLQGQLIKTLGGVQTARAPGRLYESTIQQRLAVCRAEKEQIAREALRRLQPQQTVFLDGSTTCLVLARQIARNVRGMTVVTNSAMVCLEFGGADSANSIFVLGGQFDPASACYVGPTAEEAARRFFVDVACFSTKGVLPEEGTFESSLATIRIKQIIAEQSPRVVLLADHTKFGQRALCKALDIRQIHEVVTDAGVPSAAVAELENRGVAVRVEAAAQRSMTTITG